MSDPRHPYHVGRLASVVGPVVPPVLVGLSALQALSAAGYWFGLTPSPSRTAALLLVTIALIDIVLAGVIRYGARRQRVELTGWTMVLACTVLSGGLCLIAHVGHQRITIALPYCVLVAVGATWFWLRAWHFAAGLVGIFTPPLIILLTSSPSPVEWSFSIQISGVTIAASTGIYLLARHTNSRLFTMATELQHRATFDALTGVLNRATWVDRAERLLRTDQHAGRPTSCLYLDMDGFKEINDTLGHQAGDDLLRKTAAVLRQIDAFAGAVGRLGGDEFVVLLPDTTRTEGQRLADRALALLHARLGRGDHPVASIGLATATAPESLTSLVSRADHAMMAVKDQHRRTLRDAVGTPARHEDPATSVA